MATSGAFETNSVSGAYPSPNRVRFQWSLRSQSVSGNYSDIDWNVRGWGGQSSGYWIINFASNTDINGSRVQSKGQFTMYHNSVFGSGTKRIYHNSDGSKTFGASNSSKIYQNAWNSSGSGSWSLPTIPRQATITSAPNFNDESNPTIGYSNPAGSAVSSLVASIHDNNGGAQLAPYRNISQTGSSYTFNLTSSERDALRNYCDTSGSKTVRFYVKTTIGGNTYYSYLTRTLSIVNALPVFSDFSYKDKNATAVGVTGNDQYFIQGHSEMEVTIPVSEKAVAQKFATMEEYRTTLDGNIINTNWSDTLDVVVDHGVVTASTNLTQAVSAIDSRGFSTAVNKTINVVPYAKPLLNASATRLNNFENDTTLSVSGSFSKIMVGGVAKNTIGSTAVEYRSKLQDGAWSSWNTLSRTLGDGTFTCSDVALSFDNSKYVDFEVRVTDTLETTTKAFRMTSGKPIMYVDAKRNSVGVGHIPTHENALDVSGDIYSNGEKIATENFVHEQKTLWSGAYYMKATQTATLSELISEQKNGIYLVFSEYSPYAPSNTQMTRHFIAKKMIEDYPDNWHYISAITWNQPYTKYLKIRDHEITGHSINDLGTTTRAGIEITNNRHVLVRVYGV